jgi:release factor glutamine methyltransferase
MEHCIKSALMLAQQQLEQLDARLLLAYLLDKDTTFIICNPNYRLTTKQYHEYLKLVTQRATGKPVAKIIGYKDFYNHQFITNEYTLDPRSETELIIEVMLKKYPDLSTKLKIIDIGVGSGCIIVSLLALYTNSSGVGIDISKQALRVTRENASRILNNGNKRLNLYHHDMRNTESLSRRIPDDDYILISNPPYVEHGDYINKDASFDPAIALYAKNHGLEFYYALAKLLRQTKPIFAIFEVGKGQTQQVIAIITQDTNYQVATYQDLSGVKRVISFSRNSRKP